MLILTGIKPIDGQAFWFLGASGVLGIALADTLFFRSLIYLGPRLSLLIGTLGPVITLILAVVFLKERPPLLSWLGIFLTIFGVTWVLWEQSSKQRGGRDWFSGIRYGLISIICSSIAIILAKQGVSSVSALQATFIRLIWGALGLMLWGSASRQIRNWIVPFGDTHIMKLILFTVFIAVFGGFWLFLLSLKYIGASTATILNSTTPLFVLPMTAFILKEKISIRAIIGASLAVIGVIFIFIN
jgi:drug/metabolite transporter (DMT)-like permease